MQKKITFCVKYYVQHEYKLFLINACKAPTLFSLELWNCGLGSVFFLEIFRQKSFNNNNKTSKIKVLKVTSHK